jgi:hypothetical protein
MSDCSILPCPFCGGNAEFEYSEWNEHTETGDDGMGFIECEICHTKSTYTHYDDAVDRWNRRIGSLEVRHDGAQ